MKIKQKGLLCITIVILLTLVCGITGCKQNKTAAEIEAEIKQGTMDYLNEKYEDTFTITNYLQLAFPGGSGVDLKIQSEKYQEEFSAHVDYEDDGYVYTDTYFKLTMKEDAEKYFYELAKPFFGEDIFINTKFNNNKWPEKLGKNKSFEYYMKNNSFILDVFLYCETSIEKQKLQINNFLNKIIDNKNTIFFVYFNVDNLNDYLLARNDKELDPKVHLLESKSYYINNDFMIDEGELELYKTN